MTRHNAKAMFVRQWKLLELVRGSRQGKFIHNLIEELGVSRATLYRDLSILEEAGLPLTRQIHSGQARIRYTGMDAPLPAPASPTPSAPAERTVTAHSVQAVIQEAIEERREVRLVHTVSGVSSQAISIVAPCFLRDMPEASYLVCWDPSSRIWRLFELSSITQATLAAFQEDFPTPDRDELLAQLVTTRVGALVDVAIQISSTIESMAREAPLSHEQTLELQPNGDAILRCKRIGTHRVIRWVLGWGRHAQLLEPATLRQEITHESRITHALHDIARG